MTRDQQQRLDAIAEFCRRNLAIAQNRTPGKWEMTFNTPPAVISETCDGICQGWQFTNREKHLRNMDFIAASAGAAEAGWKATLAWIVIIKRMTDCARRQEMTNDILAAYEGIT